MTPFSPLATDDDLDPLVDAIGDRPVVLLGEASHGTHEFYDWRARLTLRILQRRPSAFVAVESDWPDAYRLNRHVRSATEASGDARSVLLGLVRWPTWMWANQEVARFGDALRRINARRPAAYRTGFYGLDLYSLRESLAAVVQFLEERDGSLVPHARRALACFDTGRPARAVPVAPPSCHDELVTLLTGLRARSHNGDEETFGAEANARAALGAAAYYRSLVEGDHSWNVRDRHMMDVLTRLRMRTPDATAIVWAHNTHIGDARATDMAAEGLLNLGQLAREVREKDVFAVGFGSYEGNVVAAHGWDERAQRMVLPPSRPGSVEARLHEEHGKDGWLDLRGAAAEWRRPMGHRAVGVVYHPDAEAGNYVPTRLADRYDAFIHIERSSGVVPLHKERHAAGTPETYPFGE